MNSYAFSRRIAAWMGIAGFVCAASAHIQVLPAAEITAEQLKGTMKNAEINGKTYYFAEGDLRIEESELPAYARALSDQLERYKAARPSAIDSGAPLPGQLIVHVEDGQFMVWEPGATLSYCVLSETFTDQQEYQDVVKLMKTATEDWQKTCNIKFKHIDALDNSAPAATPPTGVLFTVRKIDDSNGPIASAFFPGYPARERHLLLFPDFFGGAGFDEVGILRHELGHTLGFRHEHIRTEAPAACQGELQGEAVPVTAYDPQSVMHYFCGGAGERELAITTFDRIGAQSVYGLPVGSERPTGFSAERPRATRNDEAFKRLDPAALADMQGQSPASEGNENR